VARKKNGPNETDVLNDINAVDEKLALTPEQQKARARALLHMESDDHGTMSKADTARARDKEPDGPPKVGRLDKDGKTKERGPFQIAPIERRRFQIGIVGRPGSPLIPHAFTAKAVRQILYKHLTGDDAVQEPKDPLYDAAHSLYVDKDGLFAFRSVAAKSAMVASLRYSGGVKMVDLMTCLHVLGEYSPIWGFPVARMDPTKVGPWNDRQLDLRFRGSFDRWCSVLTIEFEPRVIGQDAILNLVQRAGSVGIGDWRPECSGNCGLFDVCGTKEIEELKQAFGRHGRSELNAENFGIRTLLEEWGLYDVWLAQREKLEAWRGRAPVSEKMAKAMKEQAQRDAGIRPQRDVFDENGRLVARGTDTQVADAEELLEQARGRTNGETHG
jgi:hypothetical protein